MIGTVTNSNGKSSLLWYCNIETIPFINYMGVVFPLVDHYCVANKFQSTVKMIAI